MGITHPEYKAVVVQAASVWMDLEGRCRLSQHAHQAPTPKNDIWHIEASPACPARRPTLIATMPTITADVARNVR